MGKGRTLSRVEILIANLSLPVGSGDRTETTRITKEHGDDTFCAKQDHGRRDEHVDGR